jgi:hypothetical protein
MTAVSVPKARPGETPPMVELSVVGTTTAITALPVTVNLSLYMGDDFTMTINVQNPDGTPVDLTGSTVTGMVKKSASDTTAAGNLTCTLVTPATGGQISVLLANTVSSGLTTGPYVYDVQWKSAGNMILTLIAGTLGLTQDVTRP